MQEELVRQKLKKRGKKNRKSKRRIKSQVKSIEGIVFVINEDNEEDPDVPKSKEAMNKFLKNIRNHSPEANHQKDSREKLPSNRLKTEPCNNPKDKDRSLKIMKKTKILSELSQKYNFLPPKEFSPLSQPSFSPIS